MKGWILFIHISFQFADQGLNSRFIDMCFAANILVDGGEEDV